MHDVEFIEADPKLRRRALLTVLAVTAFGSLAIGWALPWMLAAIAEARSRGALSVPLACWLFLALVVLLAVPVVAFGVYAARFGRAVRASGRYPPPGAHVVRRTRVLRGPAAAIVGRGQVVAGVALVLCGVALVGVAAWGVWLLALAPMPGGRVEAASVEPGASATGVAGERAAPDASPLGSEPITRRTVLFMEATAQQIDAARTGRSPDDFAVIADDLMFYRAVAHERLGDAGAPVVRVAGRGPAAFLVEGVPRTYEFREVPTLDLLVVYVPGSAPRAFATIDVEQAIEALEATEPSPSTPPGGG